MFKYITPLGITAKNVAPSVYQHFIKYKLIIHRRTIHDKLLHKMGLTETPNCLFCKNTIETIEYMYTLNVKMSDTYGKERKIGSEESMTYISKFLI